MPKTNNNMMKCAFLKLKQLKMLREEMSKIPKVREEAAESLSCASDEIRLHVGQEEELNALMTQLTSEKGALEESNDFVESRSRLFFANSG